MTAAQVQHHDTYFFCFHMVYWLSKFLLSVSRSFLAKNHLHSHTTHHSSICISGEGADPRQGRHDQEGPAGDRQAGRLAGRLVCVPSSCPAPSLLHLSHIVFPHCRKAFTDYLDVVAGLEEDTLGAREGGEATEEEAAPPPDKAKKARVQKKSDLPPVPTPAPKNSLKSTKNTKDKEKEKALKPAAVPSPAPDATKRPPGLVFKLRQQVRQLC